MLTKSGTSLWIGGGFAEFRAPVVQRRNSPHNAANEKARGLFRGSSDGLLRFGCAVAIEDIRHQNSI
jgi:hypothetical protein